MIKLKDDEEINVDMTKSIAMNSSNIGEVDVNVVCDDVKLEEVSSGSLIMSTQTFVQQEEDSSSSSSISLPLEEDSLISLLPLEEGSSKEGSFTLTSTSSSATLQFEEERRLFYVGMTRARKRLYITYRSRFMLENGGSMPVSPSRFLKDLKCNSVLFTKYYSDKKRVSISTSTRKSNNNVKKKKSIPLSSLPSTTLTSSSLKKGIRSSSKGQFNGMVE